MQHPITAADVSTQRVAYYSLWDGEMRVTVTQDIGAHGFFSAAMVVERCDSPMECYMYDGYDRELRSIRSGGKGTVVAYATMREWVASKLNTLATGTDYAVGNFSSIEETAYPNDEGWDDVLAEALGE